MCFIADEIVRYNFSDVAVHDKRILRRMQENESRLWIVHEMGSMFLPLSCRLSEFSAREKHNRFLSSVEVIIGRFLRADELQKIQNRIVFDSARYFIVIRQTAIKGEILPISFKEIVNLVFDGKANHLVD